MDSFGSNIDCDQFKRRHPSTWWTTRPKQCRIPGPAPVYLNAATDTGLGGNDRSGYRLRRFRATIARKLFLPYFSTKRRGNGLGLAIVSRILPITAPASVWKATRREARVSSWRFPTLATTVSEARVAGDSGVKTSAS